MSAVNKRAEAPFGSPDVIWTKHSGKEPEGAIICGTANGNPVYVGRVYDENELLIGSANLSTGICTFYKNGSVCESSDFEVMHVPVGEPLDWKKVDANSEISLRTILQAGRQKDDDVFYVGRIQDGGNTFVGSVDFGKKHLYVVQDGAAKVLSEFEILIHKYLEFLCICPPCPDRCEMKSE